MTKRDEEFEVSEDESGKYHYSVWWVFQAGIEVAGPFDTEDAAEEAAKELGENHEPT